MNEFWVCPSCRSLVRASSQTCYACKSPRPANARSIATGAPGAVLTPGFDTDL
jgi:hypothetical protein